MSRFRFRESRSSSTTTIVGVLAGAAIGLAIGLFVTQRLGGIAGLRRRLRSARGGEPPVPRAADDFEELEYDADEIEDTEGDTEVELRVLEAFRNDPVLCDRAIDIGAIGEGVIELAGWVDAEDEAHRAVTIAGGVPGVATVVNRLSIGEDEERYEQTARRFAAGDPSLTEAQWEGNTVGTGKRRQGRSNEPDRHADPRVGLEERWSSTEQALADAPEVTAPSGARRSGVRTEKVRGVPKGDHVDRPMDLAPPPGE